jgi:hypothetical protein
MSDVFLYVMGREDGPVKIGISNHPYGRAFSLQTGCPFKIEVLCTRKAKNRAHALYHEALLHDAFKEYRAHGEWFDIEAELVVEQVETAFDIEKYFEERYGRQ